MDEDSSSWVQLGQDIDGEAAGDMLGISVSLSSDGKTIAIGAPFNDGNGEEAGHVRVTAWSGHRRRGSLRSVRNICISIRRWQNFSHWSQW